MQENMVPWISISIAAAVFGWQIWTYRSGARKAELSKLGERMDAVAADLSTHKDTEAKARAELRDRLVGVEQKIAQMPDKEVVHGLALSMSDMRGDIRAQGETLKGVAATGRRVEEYLLNASRGSS